MKQLRPSTLAIVLLLTSFLSQGAFSEATDYVIGDRTLCLRSPIVTDYWYGTVTEFKPPANFFPPANITVQVSLFFDRVHPRPQPADYSVRTYSGRCNKEVTPNASSNVQIGDVLNCQDGWIGVVEKVFEDDLMQIWYYSKYNRRTRKYEPRDFKDIEMLWRCKKVVQELVP